MTCPICDQKPMNCDCTETERRQFSEIEELNERAAILRLTDAEREAVDEVVDFYGGVEDERCQQIASTLRGLLERTK